MPLMHSYLRGFRGAGKEKDDFISAVNSAASSFGEFAGRVRSLLAWHVDAPLDPHTRIPSHPKLLPTE